MQAMEWDDFRLVKTIAEHRALGPAADALKLNHSTVFRKLNALEEQLGTRIFERSRNGYALTAAGEDMLVIAGQMAEAVNDFERRVAGMDARPTGEVRVTTTESIFSFLLAPIFARFREAYPGITLDVIIDSRPLNLSRRDADVAIRASSEPQETLVGRRIATMAWAPYAAAGAMLPATDDVFALDGPWIGYSEPISLSHAGRWIAARLGDERHVMTVNTVSALSQLVASGAGLGFLPCFAGDQIKSLKRLADPERENASALWVLTHADLRRSVRTRAFLDFIAGELSKNRKLIEGTR